MIGKNTDGPILLRDKDDEADEEFNNELSSLPALHTPHIDEQSSVFNVRHRLYSVASYRLYFYIYISIFSLFSQ